jgi:membrane protease YdiL (CAAX protease family)
MNTWLLVGIYYALTLFMTVLIAGTQQGSGFTTPETVILPQLGPGLAALAMLLFIKKERFSISLSMKGISLKNIALVLFVPMVMMVLVFFVCRTFIASFTPRMPELSAVPLVLGGMLLGAFGEELGWRAYAQRLVNDRKSSILAVLVVGILWGLWHIGNYQNGALYVALFLLFGIGASGVMAHLLGGTRYNLVLAALFHVVLNCGYYTMREILPDVRFSLINGVVWMLAWGIVLVLERKNVKSS